MAHNMKTLWNSSKGIINNMLFRNTVLNVTSARYMYTETALKIREYENVRLMTRTQYMAVEDTFRQKMKAICDTDKGKIYMEDLKAMLHIAQYDDLCLLSKMIEKYSTFENGRFAFGPVIMRTLYFLNAPKEALELFNKPELSNMFNKVSVYTTLMTLLYNHDMYQSVIEVWEKMISLNPDRPIGNKSTRIILFATLAKYGTEEALQKAKSIWAKLKEQRIATTREFPLYLHLLLTCQQPQEVLNELEQRGRIVVATHLKILALMQMKDYESIPPLLEKLPVDNLESNNIIFKDMYNSVRDIPPTVEARETIISLLETLPRSFRGRESYTNFIFSPMASFETIGREKNATEERQTFRQKMLSEAM